MSGERGITWYKRNSTWRVRIKDRLIGNFKQLTDAVEARNRADPSYATWRLLTPEEKKANQKSRQDQYLKDKKDDPVFLAGRKSAQLKYKKSAHGIRKRKEYQSKPETKLAHARVTGRLVNRIGIKILKMFHNGGVSGTVSNFTEFASDSDCRAFFESTFEPWMSWENYGLHRKNAGFRSAWQVGHKIPRSAYDHMNEEDIRRCWKKINLFAQDAKENIHASSKLPSKDELMLLRSVWPVAWKDSIPF